MEIKEPIFKVIVKTNAKKNELLEFNKEKQAYILNIKAPAQENKANKEIIKFLSKSLRNQVRIKSGLKSKVKIIEII